MLNAWRTISLLDVGCPVCEALPKQACDRSIPDHVTSSGLEVWLDTPRPYHARRISEAGYELARRGKEER